MSVPDAIISLFHAGGWVMYPLLALSLVSLAITLERAFFWLVTNSPTRLARLESVLTLLRGGNRAAALKESRRDQGVYARMLTPLLEAAPEQAQAESFPLGVAESLRPVVERFSVTLSTIITAAPMLGILGTVTGIIRSFEILNASETVRDPFAVAGGIGEALLTTAFGLIIALVTLFPYAVFRAQSDRCLSRFEVIGATVRDASKTSQADE